MTRRTSYDAIRLPVATRQGYAECPAGCVFDGSFLWCKPQRRRARVQRHGGIHVCGTLQCGGGPYYVYEGLEL